MTFEEMKIEFEDDLIVAMIWAAMDRVSKERQLKIIDEIQQIIGP